MKSKIFYAISLLVIIYCIFVLNDCNLLFNDAINDYGNILQIFLPLLSITLSTIIYGIGRLLEDKNK